MSVCCTVLIHALPTIGGGVIGAIRCKAKRAASKPDSIGRSEEAPREARPYEEETGTLMTRKGPLSERQGTWSPAAHILLSSRRFKLIKNGFSYLKRVDSRASIYSVRPK